MTKRGLTQLSIGLLLVSGWLGVLWAALAPRPGAAFAIVWFPPWWSMHAALAAAAASQVSIVGLGVLPSILLVHPDRAEDLVRLRNAGAWAIADAEGLTTCLVSRSANE